jgi:Protein of unknown function (DUF2842)
VAAYEASYPQDKRPLAAPQFLNFCYIAAMKLRTRKAIGTALTVVWITVYCLIVGAVGAILVLGRGVALELPFYVVAGLGWVPVEMWIIKWMSRPDVA